MIYCFEKREREGRSDNISVIRLVPNPMDKFDLAGWKDGHYVTNTTHSREPETQEYTLTIISGLLCICIAGHRRVAGSLHGLRVRRPR